MENGGDKIDKDDQLQAEECPVQSSNISSSEIDEDTQKKLRGDAIGNSLYSKSFVLKTLMRFSNVEWNEHFEEDLCFLWDMTLDKDVCEFLFSMSYPSLVCSAILRCDESRFVEIVIGILGNMFCANCEKSIDLDEVNVILEVINTVDPLILIQVMRFITAISSEFETLPFISQDILDRVKYILQNSTNKELLTRAIEAVVKITSDFKLTADKIDGDLIDSGFSGYRTLIYEHKCRDKTVLKNMVQFMCNMCGYMSNFEDGQLRDVIMRKSDTFITEVAKLLRYYNNGKHLFPLTEEFDFYVEAASYLIIILSVGYLSSLFINTFKIISLLLNNECEVTKSLLEIVTYLMSKGNIHDIKGDLKEFKATDVHKVFSFIDKEKYDCEYSYKENFTCLKKCFL